MNLQCPFCTEDISYDHRLGGKTVECSYCKKSFLMPLFDKLPPEAQQEYRAEIDKIQRKQQALEQKKQEQKQQEAIRQEQERQRQLHNLQTEAQKQNWNGFVEVAKKRIPEDDLVVNSYVALKITSSIFRVSAVLIILSEVTFLVSIRYYPEILKGLSSDARVILVFGSFIITPMIVLIFMFIAQLIDILVNVANDLKISKSLLKRIAYEQTPLP